MHVLKTVALAALAVGTTGGVALAAATTTNGSRPSEPGHTLPSTAASQAQQHAGPVLASHSTHPNQGRGHAYGRGHGTGKPAGVVGKPADAGNASDPSGPPFSVPPVQGRPSSTPPVPVPPVSTPSHPGRGDHPSGPPTAVPSHSHP